MCADCPILQGRLYGISSEAKGKVPNTEAGVCCGRCGTTLLAVRTGGLMGCSECYTVFEEAIASEMISTGKISNRMRNMQESSKKQTLHAGKTPDQKVDLTPANRIVSLNEALKEALKKENYEQAAWLRDQIKAITDERAP
jgi:protein arginine kinase activator